MTLPSSSSGLEAAALPPLLLTAENPNVGLVASSSLVMVYVCDMFDPLAVVFALTDASSKAIITVSLSSYFVSGRICKSIVVSVDNAAISATPASKVKSSASAVPLEGSAE